MTIPEIYKIFRFIKYEPVVTVNTLNDTVAISLFGIDNNNMLKIGDALGDVSQVIMETETTIFHQIELAQFISSVSFIQEGDIKCNTIFDVVTGTIQQFEAAYKTSLSSILLQNLRKRLLTEGGD